MSGYTANPFPSLVPLPLQTGAKARGFSPTALESTAETDSPLEGSGFEPSVPLPGYAGLFRDRVRRQKVERVGRESLFDRSVTDPPFQSVRLGEVRDSAAFGKPSKPRERRRKGPEERAPPPMAFPPPPAGLAQTLEHVLVILGAMPRDPRPDIHVERTAADGDCFVERIARLVRVSGLAERRGKPA